MLDKAIDKKKSKQITTELEILKKKYKCEYFKISAMTSEGVGEAFRKFLSKIHQKKIDEKQNEGIDEEQDMELEEDDVI
jgi:GTPase SAR1 family protein